MFQELTGAAQLVGIVLPSLLLLVIVTKLRRNRSSKRSMRSRTHSAWAAGAADKAADSDADEAQPAQQQLMWAMSHELRTPLSGIIGLSESLMLGHFGGRLGTDAERVVAIIQASGRHLLQLVDDVLDAAALEQGVIQMQQQRVELAPLVDQLLQAYAPLARPGVRLSSGIPAGTALLADPGRLRQSLGHLLDNACKFTLQGSIQVTAAVRPTAAAAAAGRPGHQRRRVRAAKSSWGGGGSSNNIDSSNNSSSSASSSSANSKCSGSSMEDAGPGEVEICVVDTGVGIPAQQLPHVWKLFRQADEGPARQHCGAGLGLCLVRGLVRTQGGSVDVESKEGSGTTIRMLLPAWSSSNGGSGTGSEDSMQQAQEQPQHAAASVTLDVLPAEQGSQAATPAAAAAAPGLVRPLSHSGSASSLAALLSAATAAAAAAAPGAGAAPAGAEQQQQQPPEQPPEQQPAPSASGSLGSFSKPSFREQHGRVQVLCVDDDPISQLVVKRLLGPSGYDILQVRSGREALDLMEAADCFPDVVLLDGMMPGLSGSDTCRILRQRWPDAAIPVIMLSANNHVEHISSGLSAGSNDYMTKPFNHQELLARIKGQINLSTMHRAQLRSWLAYIMSGGAAAAAAAAAPEVAGQQQPAPAPPAAAAARASPVPAPPRRSRLDDLVSSYSSPHSTPPASPRRGLSSSPPAGCAAMPAAAAAAAASSATDTCSQLSRNSSVTAPSSSNMLLLQGHGGSPFTSGSNLTCGSSCSREAGQAGTAAAGAAGAATPRSAAIAAGCGSGAAAGDGSRPDAEGTVSGSVSSSSPGSSAAAAGGVMLALWELQHVQQSPPQRHLLCPDAELWQLQPASNEEVLAACSALAAADPQQRKGVMQLQGGAAQQPLPAGEGGSTGAQATARATLLEPASQQAWAAVLPALGSAQAAENARQQQQQQQQPMMPGSSGLAPLSGRRASSASAAFSCSSAQDMLLSELLDRPASPSSFFTPLLRPHRQDLWQGPAAAAACLPAPPAAGLLPAGGGSSSGAPQDLCARGQDERALPQEQQAAAAGSLSAFGSSISGWSGAQGGGAQPPALGLPPGSSSGAAAAAGARSCSRAPDSAGGCTAEGTWRMHPAYSAGMGSSSCSGAL